METVDLETLGGPPVRYLNGKIWKMRVQAKGEIARGIYMALAKRQLVILHIFKKKTRKTPKRALDLGIIRMKQVMHDETQRP